MPTDRYDSLHPPQLVATFRSFPRRYRAAVAPVRHDADLLGRRVDGERVVDLVADTVRSLALIDRALEVTLVQSAPVLVAAVVDATERHWPECAPDDLGPLLEELAEVATALADRAEAAPLEAWSRTAAVAGGRGSRTAVDLAREGARTGAENLRHLERLVERIT